MDKVSTVLSLKEFRSSTSHAPVIKIYQFIHTPREPNHAETLALYFVAALSKSALFSSRSARNWWLGSAALSFLVKGM